MLKKRAHGQVYTVFMCLHETFALWDVVVYSWGRGFFILVSQCCTSMVNPSWSVWTWHWCSTTLPETTRGNVPAERSVYGTFMIRLYLVLTSLDSVHRAVSKTSVVFNVRSIDVWNATEGAHISVVFPKDWWTGGRIMKAFYDGGYHLFTGISLR